MVRTNFDWRPITVDQLAVVADLPFHDKAPFDRLLIAQASREGVPIVSADAQFDPYPITRLWFAFFTDTIRNPNTRTAYYCNATRFFPWAQARGFGLAAIRNYHVSA
jgi:hypothetical protein